ncbi:MAG: AmmeMemoRadiSam system protein B [Anaerolineae bacterium]|nr:AmmeMemoRadiSam system protein B [Anaerolineae bacterium]
MSKLQSVRQSVIAGAWYPGTASGLTRTVDDYLSRAAAEPLAPGQLIGLISPHAGYAYSGQTAAYAYHQLQGRTVDIVVLMGPSHHAWVGECAISAEDAYETPLGLVPLDGDFIAALASHIPLNRVRRDAEHSLEIQLPFLQRQLADFRLVPIMMSADDPAVAPRLARALVETIHEQPERLERTLLVASSDLHHIENYDQVVSRDQQVVDAVAAYDLDGLTAVLMDRHSTVCGRMPILTVFHAAQALGANQARVLHHTTSGDVTGDRTPGQYTVGYMAAALCKSE